MDSHVNNDVTDQSIYDYIISHLHNFFLFQYDVILSLNRYESPDQTVY